MPIIKQLKQHKVLLDTHVWVWLMIGNPILKPSFRKAIDQCQKDQGIWISPMTIWEIGMLVEKKRIEIEMDCFNWIEKALDTPGISTAPFSPKIAIQSSRLPGIVHGDPVDRILIATAHEENLVLVTCDQKLLEYGKDRFISVYNPT